MDEPARALVGAAMVECARSDPEFNSYPSSVQIAIVLTTAIQGLLRAEIYAAGQVDMNTGAFGIGAGLGCAAAAAAIPHLDQFVAATIRGIHAGYAETINAARAMPTTGSKN